jgi:hypothetical protein
MVHCLECRDHGPGHHLIHAERGTKSESYVGKCRWSQECRFQLEEEVRLGIYDIQC